MDGRRAAYLAIGIAAVAGTAGAVLYVRSRRNRTVNGVAPLGRSNRKAIARESVTSKGKTLKHYRSSKMPIKERVGILQDLTYRSVQDPEMRKLALQITQHCRARDGECESRAIYDWTKNNVRYTGDIGPHKLGRHGPVEGVDLFQTAARTAEFKGGDCLPAGTLLLTENFEFVPIEKLPIGTKIWGRDSWTDVKDVWFKGVLPVDTVFMNNGSSFTATPDHKVYVALCPDHPIRWSTGKNGCSCSLENRSVERIKLSQLEPGMVLVQPERITFGKTEIDPGKALIEGLFLADGWVGHDADFDISGRDGHPKEEQKREIQVICDRLGIPTYWHKKYIRVKDAEWTRRVQQMGGKAWLKRALSIDLNESAARELLRGIMADSGANTNGGGRTFTTTSRELMLQVRVLHRMLGMSCSERYIVNHGGLGEHPIHRLGVRDTNRSDGRATKLLRVKAIERNVTSLPVYDISTGDHYVYLPEADVTVSNCDDHSVLNCTLALHNGLACKYRITSPTKKAREDYSHIYAMIGLPKNSPTKWVAVDTTLEHGRFGTEAPAGKHLDFVA